MDYVEHRMAHEAAKEAASAAFTTPLNLILASVLAYTVYTSFFARRAPSGASLPRPAPSAVFRTYSPRALLPFDGRDGRPVFLAVRGRVFDVTPGRNFYGPGGPYANFAGRDASRGLACGSFDEDMLTHDLDGPLDDLAGLGSDELDALQGWEERFLEKYDVVGRLVTAKDLADDDKAVLGTGP